MAGVPLPEAADNEWVRSVAGAVETDERTLRAIVSASSEEFPPADAEKEAALKDVITDVYYKTSETPWDNSPDGYIWVQLPVNGELRTQYEYYCQNPPHPAPDEMSVPGGRNWTYVAHTVTHVTDDLREVVEDIEYFEGDGTVAVPRSEISDDELTLVRGVPGPDFRTTKHILTDGLGLEFTDIYDAYGHFRSEWDDAYVYWNEP